MRVVVHPFGESHLGEKLLCESFDFYMDLLLVFLIIWLFLRQKLFREHHIFQGGVLRKKVERLEDKPEMQSFFAHVPFQAGGGIRCVEQGLAIHADYAGVRGFQKVQTP